MTSKEKRELKLFLILMASLFFMIAVIAAVAKGMERSNFDAYYELYPVSDVSILDTDVAILDTGSNTAVR